jgi:phosphoribosylformylglycinamidine cyclo-ligase
MSRNSCEIKSWRLRGSGQTHNYVLEAMELLAQVPSIKAFVHITGDGFLNLTRVKADVSLVIDALPQPPPIFSIIRRLGEVDAAEMYFVFNMGIGFCAVVAPADADKAVCILSSKGKRAYRIGHAVADPARKVTLVKEKLVGRNKKFTRLP